MSFPRIMWSDFGEELKTYQDTLGFERYDQGQKMMLPDGRTFRFARTGGTTLVAGTLQQSAVPVANHIGQTIVTATAVGATAIAVTLGATAMDYDLYGGGVISDESGGTGKGFYYPIVLARGNFNNALANAAASAAISVPLQTGYSVNPAINTSDVVSLIMNPWKNVVINATAQTAPTCGVANFAAVTHGSINTTGGNARGVQMGDLTWIQTAGICLVRTDTSTVVAGQPVASSSATAGDVMLATTASTATNPFVGQCIRVASSGNWSTINLMIADY